LQSTQKKVRAAVLIRNLAALREKRVSADLAERRSGHQPLLKPVCGSKTFAKWRARGIINACQNHLRHQDQIMTYGLICYDFWPNIGFKFLCFSRMWLGAESNRRHEDFQSSALPTELPSRCSRRKRERSLCRNPFFGQGFMSRS